MRDASRFLAILGVVVLLVAVATPASANCVPTKIASTFSPTNYVYIDLGAGVTASQVVGSFYAAGNPSANNGSYPASSWLFVDLGGKLSMNASLGDARVNGCPAGTLVVRVQASTPTGVKFLTMTAVEGASGTSTPYAFWLGRANASLITGALLPRPRVVNSGRVGPNVNLNVSIDPTTGGSSGDSAGDVTGYELVKASGADPGRDPAGWTVAATIPVTDGAPVPSTPLVADCSNTAVDQYFATRLLFGDGQKSDLVSDSTRVNCNPTLAEPRFNVVPKKPVGPKKPLAPGTQN